jgi:hypothetical protein
VAEPEGAICRWIGAHESTDGRSASGSDASGPPGP